KRNSAEPDDVLGGRPLLALDHVEFDLLALGKRLEAAPLNGGVMDEAVLRPILGRDEPETLAVVEPLHRSDGTHPQLLVCDRLSRCGSSVPPIACAIRGLYVPRSWTTSKQNDPGPNAAQVHTSWGLETMHEVCSQSEI